MKRYSDSGMRFFVAVLLSVSMIVSLCACGSAEKDTDVTEKRESYAENTKIYEPEDSEPSETADTSESNQNNEDVTDPENDGTDAPETKSSFKACSFSPTVIGTFRYWLYTPSDPVPDMPLIVYLHGGSGKGDDLNLITAVDGFPKYLQSGELGDVRAYVVIPQLPSSMKGWANAGSAVFELIQITVSKFGINKNNISLTGHSMGGTGTWALATAYPTLFARIAPLSGSIKTTDDAVEKLKNIPVRAFVGSADTIVPPESTLEIISVLKSAGADAEVTVFDGADHFTVPSLTYTDSSIDIIGWLIGNSK